MRVGACSKKPGNNEKQTGKKEPPLVLTKESGRVMGDGREGDAQPSSTQPPEGLRRNATKAFLLGWKEEKLAQPEDGPGSHRR